VTIVDPCREHHDPAFVHSHEVHFWKTICRRVMADDPRQAGGISGGGPLDIAIIGGGINGTGIARDAAGRGLSVVLAEQDDLASHTSSASTKLIHGGLRYLENYDFRLVREALLERERLMESAPHIIRPLRFVLPHDPSIRPAWLVRLGLAFYDRLAPRRHLQSSKSVNLLQDAIGRDLNGLFSRGFVYSDCRVDDSRLVALTALDAAERGASILMRTKVISAARVDGLWDLTLQSGSSGETSKIQARAIVNATGPWAASLCGSLLGLPASKKIRHVKGSHIAVPALYPDDHAFILQNGDQRIVFVIPYESRFTLIGTTDIPFEGDPGRVEASAAEIGYLCTSVSRYFRARIAPGDAVWTYAGVRLLIDDGAEDPSAISRDYALDLEAPQNEAPALSIFGGKITTFRRLAEQALETLRPRFPKMRQSWTAKAKLPGGDIENGDFNAFAITVLERWPFLGPDTALRLAHSYGTRAERILGAARCMGDLGRDFGRGLSEAELDYLARDEWAQTADDALWRRSKLGLHLSKAQAEAVAVYYGQKCAA
jgi:glycerol-3-phosphate dehydrogenase